MASATESQGVDEVIPWWQCLAEHEATRFLRRQAGRHPLLARRLWRDREDWIQEAHLARLEAFPEAEAPPQGEALAACVAAIRSGLRKAWRASGLGRNRQETQDWPAPIPIADGETFPRPWERVVRSREADPADQAAANEQKQMLAESLGELLQQWPAAHRLIRQRYHEDRSVADIAQDLGVRERCVRADLAAILEWLFNRLQSGGEATCPVNFPAGGEAA
jgi:DNA-directed RNA polymerase specialized sigma24 family protein